jgi:hypothetical protein
LITAAAVLLFTWAQSPAFAQDFWVWDATESYPLSNGDLQLDLQIGVETGWFTADVPIGSAYIPGAVIPAHNDCNCNSIDAQTVQGSWSFYAETEEAGLYEWEVTGWYDLFGYGYATSDCTACLLCDSPADYSEYQDYYSQENFDLLVTFE